MDTKKEEDKKTNKDSKNMLTEFSFGTALFAGLVAIIVGKILKK